MAKSPQISSFFKQADKPEDQEEKPGNIPKASISTEKNVTEEQEELFPLSGPGIEWYRVVQSKRMECCHKHFEVKRNF